MRQAVLGALLMAALIVPVGLWSLSAGADQGAASQQQPAKAQEPPFKGLRVAILTGEGFHDAETMMPLAFLANRGAEVTLLGPAAGKVKAYNNEIHLYIQKAVSDVPAADFHALVLPGGKAPALIRQEASVLDFTREFAKLGRPIAAICHGPQVLVTAGVVKGRAMTCVSGMADELRSGGANYRDEAVVRDQHLVTSRVPSDIPVWLSTLERSLRESAKPAKE